MVDTPRTRAAILTAAADGGAPGNYTLQKLRDLVMSIGNIPPNVQTTNYSLALSDADCVVEMNSATAKTVTIPTNATVAFPAGQVIYVRQVGVGAVTIAGSGGVTLDSRSGFGVATSAKWDTLMLHQRATDEWVVQPWLPTGDTYVSLRNAGLPTGGDDTTAINAVLSAAKTAGAGGTPISVYAPAGTYKHAGLLTVDSVTLFGDGPATIFQSTDTTGTNPNLTIKLTGTAPQIRDMTVSTTWAGARQSNPESTAVWVNSATGFLVSGLVVNGAGSAGIFMQSASDGRVEGNRVNNTLADAIGHYYQSFDIVTTNNRIYNAGDDCISVVGYVTDTTAPYSIRIANNKCKSGQARGIAVVGGDRVNIIGNDLDGITDAAIYVSSESAGSNSTLASTNVIALGNNIYNSCTQASGYGGAILVDGRSSYLTTGFVAMGNVISNTPWKAIGIGSGGGSYVLFPVIANNQCLGQASGTANAIGVQGAISPTIQGNVIYQWQYEGIADGAGNSGYATVSSNTFDKVGGSSAYAINVTTSGFSGITLKQNSLRVDGATSVQGIIDLSGVAAAEIEGNLTDRSGGPANSISSVTKGHYFDPYGANIFYGQTSIGSAGTQTLSANAQTITTSGLASTTLSAASGYTGIILQAGTTDGQKVTIFNNSSSTVTWNATDATAKVKGASSNTIAANGCQTYTWNGTTSLWWRST